MSGEMTSRPAGARRWAMQPRLLAGVVLMLGVIGAFYVVKEHWGHLADGWWPYLLLLVCPLLHVVFHGGDQRH